MLQPPINPNEMANTPEWPYTSDHGGYSPLPVKKLASRPSSKQNCAWVESLSPFFLSAELIGDHKARLFLHPMGGDFVGRMKNDRYDGYFGQFACGLDDYAHPIGPISALRI